MKKVENLFSMKKVLREDYLHLKRVERFGKEKEDRIEMKVKSLKFER